MSSHLPVMKLRPDAFLPVRGTEGSAGYDLISPDDHDISNDSTATIKLGIAVQIPEGYCGKIESRSSLSSKFSIEAGAGVIDSDYRGEIGVVLHNLSRSLFNIKRGDKIAQMLIIPVLYPKVSEVYSLTDTKRGTGGYGSTGRNIGENMNQ